MIRYWFFNVLCFVAIIGISSCSKSDDNLCLSNDEEISFCLSETVPMMQSRATLYNSESDLYNPASGGGNFTVYAHYDGTDNTYLSGERVWFFDDPQVLKWIFLDENEKQMICYWPPLSKINFFAFMPDKKYNGKDGYQSKETFVTVGQYSDSKGQVFSCNMPAFVSNKAKSGSASGKYYNSDMQEFIYAYVTQQTAANDPVELLFKHPFALINFKVQMGSHRMTIDRIEFENIHLKGDFSTKSGSWTPTGNAVLYTAEIGKRIPNDVNYNTLVGDAFMVMPQKLTNAKIRLVYNREENGSEPITIEKAISIDWLPGKSYTYTVSVGDNNSEIYFNVMVDEDYDWIIKGENNIEVE